MFKISVISTHTCFVLCTRPLCQWTCQWHVVAKLCQAFSRRRRSCADMTATHLRRGMADFTPASSAVHQWKSYCKKQEVWTPKQKKSALVFFDSQCITAWQQRLCRLLEDNNSPETTSQKTPAPPPIKLFVIIVMIRTMQINLNVHREVC